MSLRGTRLAAVAISSSLSSVAVRPVVLAEERNRGCLRLRKVC
jgi:hypothetical protein